MRAVILSVLAVLLVVGPAHVRAQDSPTDVPTTITITGGARAVKQRLPAGQGQFGLRVPLKLNADNILTVTATDKQGRRATVSDLKITHLALTEIVVAEVKAQRLTTQEVEQLLAAGTIDMATFSSCTRIIFSKEVLIAVGSA